ncbi:acyltransferase ChoActase/COT/CPT [Rhizophagus irregularis]|uniref:Acyltransferase ChoActase/COT/CPT n=1 Tax=Rhizophagus irregularis TaxID=588596 RepID=A0A2N0PM13_9GLOM|nr:acyltransferase ChoActase/COT/CPT [Rhizophagus irregularis]
MRTFLSSTSVRTLPSTIIKRYSLTIQNSKSYLICPILSRNYSLQIETDKPKTFSNQHIIPRLPIPTLQETTERYKKSLLPILKPEEYTRAANAVDEFVKADGLGEVLQKRLHELDKIEKYRWLENIWLNKAYLEWREPSIINVNWWCEFKDHPNGVLKQVPKGQITDFQINRTAGLISNILSFNDEINNELLPPESTRQGPLCMNQYKKQFGTTRIADSPVDRVISPWPATAKHIIVLFRDQIFKVQVLGEGGARVTIKDIERQLKSIVEQINNTNELQLPIGLLTGEHRDTWATARKALESQSSENRSNFEAIDTALFSLSLDDYSTDSDIDVSHHNLFHAFNGRNRWFDKCLQLIVQSNGRAGVNGEHSPADAVIPGRIFDYIVSKEPAQDPPNSSSIPLPTPQHLKWVTYPSLETILEKAQSNIQAANDNVDSVLLHYNEYGSNWLKSAKLSPDAFIQMALQLAYYRRQGGPCPTYESASTRGFLHGRTETVRSCSIDSVAFTKAFDDKDFKKEQKLALLTKAIETHLEYMISATNGKGVDRHLLGLRCQIQTEEEKSRALIFTDPSYIQSMYFKLSSSNLSPGDYFYGGFGAVVPEGYGVNYAIGKEGIKFSISSYKKYSETDSTSFRKILKNSLDDLRDFVA